MEEKKDGHLNRGQKQTLFNVKLPYKSRNKITAESQIFKVNKEKNMRNQFK